MSLSVFMITKNEEANLPRALDSAKWADEIVVVDSGSTDKTVEIARKFTDSIHSRVFTDYADQKNFAMSRATGSWLLSLDADEELTPELVREIRTVTSGSASHDAYRIQRRSNIFGRWFRFTGTQDDKPIRLFRAGRARFIQPIHEKIETGGSIGVLKNAMNHYTYPSVCGYIERFNRYTSMEADLLIDQPGPGFSDLWLKPAAMFLRLYLWKLGFLDGTQGLLFSLFSGCYVFTKHAKRWENARSRRG